MEKIVQYVGTKYGKYIRNKLQSKAAVKITEPVHSNEIITGHVLQEEMVRNGQANVQDAQLAISISLQDAIDATPMVDANTPTELALLEN